MRPLLETHLPFLLTDSGGWTAYLSSETDVEQAYEQKSVHIHFKEHPHWKGDYEEAGLAILLKILDNRCVGHYTSELVFTYADQALMIKDIQRIKAFCLETEPGVRITEDADLISFQSAVDSSTAYFKIVRRNGGRKYRLYFSTVPVFFEYD